MSAAPGPVDPGVRIGHVHLKVADLERAVAFYHGVLGLEVMQRMGGQAAFLGAGGYHHHLGLNTWESRAGRPPAPGTTGLFHAAILYPTRRALAGALRRLLDANVRLDGAADHGVSEALYLRDPDGNGLELYRDRPREAWPRTPAGELAMHTRALDLADLLGELDEQEPGSEPAPMPAPADPAAAPLFALFLSPTLRLEFLKEEDAPALFALTEANRARLREWLPWLDGIRNGDDTLAFIRARREAFLRSGCAVCGLWHEGRLAGVAGHNRIDRYALAATLGYWLGGEFEGRGLATAAVRGLAGHAFRELRLNKVVIQAAVGNARSQAVADRLGFVREGVLRDGEQLYGRFVDVTVNGLLKRDWR